MYCCVLLDSTAPEMKIRAWKAPYALCLLGLSTCVFIVFTMSTSLQFRQERKEWPQASRGQSHSHGHHLARSARWHLQTQSDNVTSLTHKAAMAARIIRAKGATRTELKAVEHNLNICLNASNLILFFKKHNYYTTAKENARQLMLTMRRIIPHQFSITDPVPCWGTQWQVQGSRSSPTVWGNIGNFHFNHSTILYPPETLKLLHDDYGGHLSFPFVCVPKVFLAGFPKCGSTYLYCLLSKIAQVEASYSYTGPSESVKEPRWWAPAGEKKAYMQPLQTHHLAAYLLNYVQGVQSMLTTGHALTIDASQNLLFQWPRFSSSESFENYCLLPAVLPLLFPTSKYIVIIRNPIHTLYSAFWFSCSSHGVLQDPAEQRKGPDVFHSRVVQRLREVESCRQTHPIEICLIDSEPVTAVPDSEPQGWAACGRVKLESTMYHFHIRKWLSVVPRKHFLFISNEEMLDSVVVVANKIAGFMGYHTRFTHASEELKISKSCRNSQESIDYHSDPHLWMREDTRKLLDDFFKSFLHRSLDLYT